MKHSEIFIATLRLKWLLVMVCSMFALPGQGSVIERLPFGNTGNATTVVPAILEKTNKVRIDYEKNMSVVITDDAWISRLKKLLTGASYKPESYCFCHDPLNFILLADDSQLLRFSVPHGMKIRFLGSKTLSGDFAVSKETAEAILALAREKQSLAVVQSHGVPPKPTLPKQIEFKP